MAQHPLIESLLVEVLSECFKLPVKAQLPGISFAIPLSVTSCLHYPSFLLRLEVLFLNAALPATLRTRGWQQLFNTAVDGKSFSKLISRIANKGPILIVVKGKTSHLFGL
jgi:hypothetical protein